MSTYNDLSDHPFAIFMAGESYVSPAERAWEEWVQAVELALGHDLDGNEETDGYSLDYAHDAFMADTSVEDYVSEVNDEKDALAAKKGGAA